MTKFFFLLVIAVAASGPLCAQSAAPEKKPDTSVSGTEIYDPKQLDALRAKKGQKITVEGSIVRSGENRAATIRYLNFTQNYRESVSLLFVVSKNAAEFTAEKLTAWVGKKVRATGMLKEYGSDLQLEIEKLDQLQEVP